jgi:hypothetical protein
MEIKVSAASLVTVVPDVGNNLDLPEGEQFRIVMQRPSRWNIQKGGLRPIIKNGEVEMEIDRENTIRLYVKRFINAPLLKHDDGSQREMTVQDLFEYDELAPVLAEVESTMREMNEAEPDRKN